ncbi:MAG: 3-dehydroquinate synthase [Kofleriaceae bacterium]|nr:3-dehydroquinate synthase [Kofleriaceae bacterium]MCL4227311.1 3-dehydroquinate synthase [Myxococcales bacterium]
MSTPVPRHLFLVGFPAAGKSTVGTLVATALGRAFVDLDDAIAARAGRPAAALVAADEADFRRREAAALAELAAAPTPAVIATGGGAAPWGDNLARMRAAGLVVTLAVDLDVALARAAGGDRPLLGQPRAALEAMYRARAVAYRRAHAVVPTDGRAPAVIAAELAELVRRAEAAPPAAAWVSLGERSYPIVVSAAPLDAALAPHVRPGRAALVADGNLGPWIDAARAALTAAGADVHVEVVPPGEASKSLDSYGRIAAALIAAGLDRWGTIWALGGGVVGDLAGFVAATLYRGVDVVQLPTTLVAMTDSAIGGKTAVDVPAGKNLIGAFHQPRLVHVHTPALDTLPPRERRAGFGELWKYALLDGAPLWDRVEALAPWAAGPAAPTPAAAIEVIERAATLKAAIVSSDERERRGERALLNLGHTIGHAIEAAAGWSLLHGECVALGLVAMARVSHRLGLATADLEPRLAAALAATGLPTDLRPWLTPEVLARVTVDKKRRGTHIGFVACATPGDCRVIDLAPADLADLLRP